MSDCKNEISKIRAVWYSMKDRCLNPKSTGYKYYGARGITVCSRWENSFDLFFIDMGCRPSKNHSIDRINNDMGYRKDNCKWATKKEQSMNRRNNVYFEIDGISKSIAAWSIEKGVSVKVMTVRRNRGWSVYDILNIPIGEKRKIKHKKRKLPKDNKRTRLITEYGITMKLTRWCEALEINQSTVSCRIRNGMSEHDALFMRGKLGNNQYTRLWGEGDLCHKVV